MSTTSTPVAVPQDSTASRFRNLAVGALFALVLILPKLLNLRRDRRSWLAFRVLLAISGAALVILPLSLWNSWTAGIAGLAMFLAAILLPDAKPDTTLADTAARLGALVIVNGGMYQRESGEIENAQVRDLQQDLQLQSAERDNSQFSPVQLFVCAERIWALDVRQRPL
ncbi:MAG TPA: hypothetical protein VFO27_16495, partial [Bryobacteraceae bacterium]|nr:hypothetical protein [Bryobacteraceae bacterium]